MHKRLQHISPRIFISVAIIIIFCLAAAFIIFRYDTTFALPDKAMPQNQVQLCSPYANLCFTRPSNWTRSSILHVSGTADNTIEINPPTGTIMEFAKPSDNTATHCDTSSYKQCIVRVSKVTSVQSSLKVVTGMLISSPDANCTESCADATFLPFVTLMSADDFTKYKLGDNTSVYTTFNPTLHVKHGQSAFLQITPGKEFNADTATKWQNGSEAKTAQQILASVKPYR